MVLLSRSFLIALDRFLHRFFQRRENPVVALGFAVSFLIATEPKSAVNADKNEKKLREPMDDT